jgi:hypothetical protein
VFGCVAFTSPPTASVHTVSMYYQLLEWSGKVRGALFTPLFSRNRFYTGIIKNIDRKEGKEELTPS